MCIRVSTCETSITNQGNEDLRTTPNDASSRVTISRSMAGVIARPKTLGASRRAARKNFEAILNESAVAIRGRLNVRETKDILEEDLRRNTPSWLSRLIGHN
jgi:hypothetical protein